MRAAALVAVLIGCGNAGANAPPDGAAAPDAAAATDALPPDAPRADAPSSPAVALADVVTAAPGASGTGFGDPHNAVNGVRGGGTTMGSLDVYSLGYGAAGNESITLAWSAGTLHNGAGPDLAVFENPFLAGGGVFMDQIIVEVSRDATNWREIAHHYAAADEAVYSNDPSLWHGFGGVTPVLLNADTNAVDPFDLAAAGGDQLDLDDVVGTDAEAAAIRADGATYVRLVAAPSRTNPDTGAPYVHDPLANGPDVDGVYGRYVGP